MPNVLAARFYRHREVTGLQKITVRQKFENHTVAFLDYRITDHKNYLLPPENTLVEAQYGVSPTGVQTFYGYVNHYETTTDDQERAMVRLVAVGTSRVMNAMNPNSWLDTSRSAVARDIVRRYKLRSMIHNHPYVVETWATGARSDFQALKAIANETGYRLWVDGSTAYLLDPLELLRSASSMSTPVVQRRAVRQVQVFGGSNIPGEMEPSTRRIQHGLDYRTNEPFESTSGDPTLPTVVSDSTVNTFGEAQERADATERQQQEYYTLKAQIDGNANLFPGVQVKFESGRVSTDQGGLWLTAEATHEITPNDFFSKIVATRGVDRLPLARVPATVRGASGITSAVVRDGKTWEAAFQEHVHV